MKELITIQSELKASKNQYNRHGGYKYRNAEDILESVKPILKKLECYLIMSDEPVIIGTFNYIIAHVTICNNKNVKITVNAVAREAEIQKGMHSAQITGSTSSYARKYALNGLFCIDDTKDDDTKPPPPVKTAAEIATDKANLIVKAKKCFEAIKQPTPEIELFMKEIDAYDSIVIVKSMTKMQAILTKQG